MTTREYITQNFPSPLKETVLLNYQCQLENGEKKRNNCCGMLDSKWHSMDRTFSSLFFWKITPQGDQFWRDIRGGVVSLDQANKICLEHPEWWQGIKIYNDIEFASPAVISSELLLLLHS